MVASPLGSDDWSEGRVTSSVMSSGTEEEEGGPATTAMQRKVCLEVFVCERNEGWGKKWCDVKSSCGSSVSCCEEQADRRKREDKVFEKQNNESQSAEKNMQREAAIKDTQNLSKKIQKAVSWSTSVRLSPSIRLKDLSWSKGFKFVTIWELNERWTASPAEELKIIMWKVFSVWSSTFPYDLNSEVLRVRGQDLFRLGLPFVGAEVEDSLQRLWPLSFGERAPFDWRLVGGRVVWIVAPTVILKIL